MPHKEEATLQQVAQQQRRLKAQAHVRTRAALPTEQNMVLLVLSTNVGLVQNSSYFGNHTQGSMPTTANRQSPTTVPFGVLGIEPWVCCSEKHHAVVQLARCGGVGYS